MCIVTCLLWLCSCYCCRVCFSEIQITVNTISSPVWEVRSFIFDHHSYSSLVRCHLQFKSCKVKAGLYFMCWEISFAAVLGNRYFWPVESFFDYLDMGLTTRGWKRESLKTKTDEGLFWRGYGPCASKGGCCSWRVVWWRDYATSSTARVGWCLARVKCAVETSRFFC